jgi:hypothetical protein
VQTRIARLPQHGLITSIRDLQQELKAIKEGQATSDRSGIVSYETVSGSTWDLTGTIGSDADTTNRVTTFTVTWVGDGSQDIAFANVIFNVFVNGTDSAHQLTPQTHSWTDGTRQAAITYLGYSGISHHTYPTQFSLTTLKAITYFVKAYALASSPGTLTVTT